MFYTQNFFHPFPSPHTPSSPSPLCGPLQLHNLVASILLHCASSSSPQPMCFPSSPHLTQKPFTLLSPNRSPPCPPARLQSSLLQISLYRPFGLSTQHIWPSRHISVTPNDGLYMGSPTWYSPLSWTSSSSILLSLIPLSLLITSSPWSSPASLPKPLLCMLILGVWG